MRNYDVMLNGLRSFTTTLIMMYLPRCNIMLCCCAVTFTVAVVLHAGEHRERPQAPPAAHRRAEEAGDGGGELGQRAGPAADAGEQHAAGRLLWDGEETRALCFWFSELMKSYETPWPLEKTSGGNSRDAFLSRPGHRQATQRDEGRGGAPPGEADARRGRPAPAHHGGRGGQGGGPFCRQRRTRRMLRSASEDSPDTLVRRTK